jgi:hypothetical protein
MTKKGAIRLFLVIALTILMTSTIFVFSRHESSNSTSDNSNLLLPLFQVEASNPTGPTARNRIWRLFNNSCRRDHSETSFELNVCRAIRRQTQQPVRQQALLTLRSMGAIQFDDYQLSFLMRGLASAPADNVIMVTRRIAAAGPLGRFVLELTDDQDRMRRFLTGQQILLE